MLKVIFFGLGHIALRHVTHLRSLVPDVTIHAYRTLDLTPTPPDITPIYRLSEVARGAYDIAFITNPTPLHIATATFAATMGIPNMFVEKPLGVTTDGLHTLLREVGELGTATYVAYPLRHHHRLSSLEMAHPSYELVCGTDLDRWHAPNPPSTYSLSPAKGGGVILELSHELDLATHHFGLITDYELSDCWGLVGSGGLPSGATVRVQHASGAVGTIRLSLCGTWPTVRHISTNGTRVDYSATDDLYRAQMAYFLAHLGRTGMVNNVHSAAPLLRVLADLHKQSIERVSL